jgi:hypothetical protein
MSFDESTHNSRWIMSSEDITLLRTKANNRDLSNEKTYTLPNSNVSLNNNLISGNKRDRDIIDITQEEQEILSQEDFILRKFCFDIQDFGKIDLNNTEKMSRKHWRVSATAISYFQRFYLNNSLLSHDPRLVAVTCLFLAGKVEECRVDILELKKLYSKCTLEIVISFELLLLEALDFNLRVFHPLNEVHTLIADIKRVSIKLANKKDNIISNEHIEISNNNSIEKSNSTMEIVKDKNENEIISEDKSILNNKISSSQKWASESEKILKALQLTYANLKFSPLIIAISSLRLTEQVVSSSLISNPASISVNQYLYHRFGQDISVDILKQSHEVEKLNQYCIDNPIELSLLTSYLVRLKKKSVWKSSKTNTSKSSGENLKLKLKKVSLVDLT